MYLQSIERNFNQMLHQFGEAVTIDGVEGVALISSKKTGVSTDFDDKGITTPQEIKRGSTIIYKGKSYLSIAEVGTKKYSIYYEGFMRRCDLKLKFISQGVNFESIAFTDTKSTGQTSDGLVVLPSQQVIVTIPVSQYTPNLVKDYTVKFAMYGHNYSPKMYDQTKAGLIVIDAQLVV